MKQPEKLHPGTTLRHAVLSETIRGLTPVEAIVYLRLVALSEPHACIYPTNAEVHKDTDATVNAIRKLEKLGLIKIRRGKKVREVSHVGREIEVLR